MKTILFVYCTYVIIVIVIVIIIISGTSWGFQSCNYVRRAAKFHSLMQMSFSGVCSTNTSSVSYSDILYFQILSTDSAIDMALKLCLSQNNWESTMILCMSQVYHLNLGSCKLFTRNYTWKGHLPYCTICRQHSSEVRTSVFDRRSFPALHPIYG